MPLSALLILFDLVIHNPTHAETQANLNLLEAAAGYFSSLEYATDGNLPCSMMVEFAYIARSFIQGNPLRHQLVSNQYEAGANLDPNLPVPIENWQPSINPATDVRSLCILTCSISLLIMILSSKQLSYPQDSETGLMEHLNFPLNMNASMEDMPFSGLEIMDLFGAPIHDL